MKTISRLALLALAGYVRAHGDHGHGKAEGETIQQYAQRHMATEHHIDSFDVRSFFHLHDLNRDGFWDKEEVEAVYGVHHIYNKKKSKDDEEHQRKADHIVNTVLALIDKDHDGKISLKEMEAAGLDALPNFDDAEGHHYDVESEFFLHHEETYHNTPETQTDESYNHPEDLEHFAHHESIEHVEAEKEAKYQGITVEEALAAHEHDGEIVSVTADATGPSSPKFTRVTSPEKQDPAQKFRDAKKSSEAQPEWGAGDGGYKTPVSPAEKMRKNVPYKYKFRRSFGDF